MQRELEEFMDFFEKYQNIVYTGKTKRAYLWAYRSGALDEGPPLAVFDIKSAVLAPMPEIFYRTGKVIWWWMIMEDTKPSLSKASPRWAVWRMHVENSLICMRPIRVLLLRRPCARSLSCMKSSTARALDYSLKRWQALSLFADTENVPIGRVEMWRGGSRQDISVSALFVWRCLIRLTITPFPHPALFQHIKLSHSRARWWSAGVSVPVAHIGTGQNIGDIPLPFCRAYASTRFANDAQRNHRSTGRSAHHTSLSPTLSFNSI